MPWPTWAGRTSCCSAPVFAGDTIYAESEVLEVRDSSSRPGQGIVRVHTRGFNQDGVTVLEYDRAVLVYSPSRTTDLAMTSADRSSLEPKAPRSRSASCSASLDSPARSGWPGPSAPRPGTRPVLRCVVGHEHRWAHRAHPSQPWVLVLREHRRGPAGRRGRARPPSTAPVPPAPRHAGAPSTRRWCARRNARPGAAAAATRFCERRAHVDEARVGRQLGQVEGGHQVA